MDMEILKVVKMEGDAGWLERWLGNQSENCGNYENVMCCCLQYGLGMSGV